MMRKCPSTQLAKKCSAIKALKKSTMSNWPEALSWVRVVRARCMKSTIWSNSYRTNFSKWIKARSKIPRIFLTFDATTTPISSHSLRLLELVTWNLHPPKPMKVIKDLQLKATQKSILRIKIHLLKTDKLVTHKQGKTMAGESSKPVLL